MPFEAFWMQDCRSQPAPRRYHLMVNFFSFNTLVDAQSPEKISQDKLCDKENTKELSPNAKTLVRYVS